MRALVTGAAGFVGRYLVDALRTAGDSVVACGGPTATAMLPIDLAEATSLRGALDIAQPDVVFHLAAQTFVPQSLENPLATYETNVIGTARLALVIHDYATATGRMPRLFFASSAEVYGAQPDDAFPLRETATPQPANPYAASKLAAEEILLAHARSFDIDVVIARAFNHIGAGQDERFVVANFAAQLARLASQPGTPLYVGNLDARRDFLDVRDVVAAYIALARDGERSQTYNVCSGVARTIREVLGELIVAAHVPVEVRDDPARMRPADVPLFIGCNAKLQARTGWQPRIPFSRSLRDIYEAARSTVAP